MSRKIILSIVGVLAAVFYLSSVAIAAGPNTDPRCLGLTGAAFGMCQAATAVGCDGSATQNPGCVSIEDNFTQVTGENPPWLSLCPCSEKYWEYASHFVGPVNYGESYCDTGSPPPSYAVVESYDTGPGGFSTIDYRAGLDYYGVAYCDGVLTYTVSSDYDNVRHVGLSAAQVEACIAEIIGIAEEILKIPCGM